MSFGVVTRIWVTSTLSFLSAKNEGKQLLGAKYQRILPICLLVATGLFCPSLALASDWDYDLHDNAWEHNRTGEWLLSQKDFVGALTEFNAGLLMSAGSGREATFYNNLGMTWMNLGQAMQAVDAFQMACRLAPTYALYRLNLIRAYTQAQQVPELERALLHVMNENPEDAEACFLLGLLYRSQNQAEKAIEQFKNYLKLQPGSEMARAAKLLIKEQEAPEHK
jgi:tetratricopeptide (TPR) repeat protein